MRHVIGIGLAIGLAARGVLRRQLGLPAAAADPRGQRRRVDAARAAAASLLHNTHRPVRRRAPLAGTALLAGIFIAVRRISPLAAGLPGLALIAWTVVYGFSVRRAVHYIPLRDDAFGAGFEAMLSQRAARGGRPGARRAAVHPVPLAVASAAPPTGHGHADDAKARRQDHGA